MFIVLQHRRLNLFHKERFSDSVLSRKRTKRGGEKNRIHELLKKFQRIGNAADALVWKSGPSTPCAIWLNATTLSTIIERNFFLYTLIMVTFQRQNVRLLIHFGIQAFFIAMRNVAGSAICRRNL